MIDVSVVNGRDVRPPAQTALQLLIAAVENDDPDTGSVAAWAIGGLGPDAHSALTTLYRASGSGHRGMRDAATWAIGRIERGR